MIPSETNFDPDRFFNRTSPGAHEWWYFDAISDDGRDVIVIVFYAGLPFDPAYGVATLRHLKNPSKYPQPQALDHSAIGFSWHRDGKLVAYALNSFKADQFWHQAKPFSIGISHCQLDRNESGYDLRIETPSVAGRPIVARFQFTPAEATTPIEENLGTEADPHNWIMAACDCRVEGKASVGGKDYSFVGRGYHDHNAGAEDLTVAMKRWEWGRAHHGGRTEIYYISEPKQGTARSLWITCVDGKSESIRTARSPGGQNTRIGNIYGVRHDRIVQFPGEGGLSQTFDFCLDDGPFYRRWIGRFGEPSDGKSESAVSDDSYAGIAEVLDTRNLHKPWFNWMIPYRLKRPT